jgi:putative transposase
MEIGPLKKRYTEEQIIGFMREADAGLPVKELCRKQAAASQATTPGRPSPVG